MAETSLKGRSKAVSLGKLTSRIAGPSIKKRKLLCSVAESILLYGAPVWAEAMKVKKYLDNALRVEQICALKCARAYRTIAIVTLLVIARMILLDLLVEERRLKLKSK